jgi:hypothetical protein
VLQLYKARPLLMSTLSRPEDIAHAARINKGEVENATSPYSSSSSHATVHSDSSVKTQLDVTDAHIDQIFGGGNLGVSASVTAEKQS